MEDDDKVYEEVNEYDDSDEEPDDEEGDEEAEVDDDFDEEEIETGAENYYQRINEKDDNHIIIHIVPENERRTDNRIKKEEMAEAIGIRACHIEYGSPALVPTLGLTNPIDISKKEFIEQKSTLIVRREVARKGNHVYVEEYKVREMTYTLSRDEIQEITLTDIQKAMTK